MIIIRVSLVNEYLIVMVIVCLFGCFVFGGFVDGDVVGFVGRI